MAQVNTEENVDRLSFLPDSILVHILSVLPTNVAVSTCILLTRSRWRDIFPSLNNLDFDQSLVNNPNSTSPFVGFVDRCMMLKNGTPIDKLRLKCSNAVNTSSIHSWICAALCSNVRELDLCIGKTRVEKEYSHVFTSNTLVVLKLGAGFSLNVTASVYFPCLKIIHLESITLACTDSSLERFVSSSPVLEDLLILGCYMKNVSVLSLSSPSLKRLTIDNPHSYDPYKLVLDTPSLVYLKFDVCIGEGHILKNLGSLREAHVNISCWWEGRVACHELLEGLRNVQSLYLSGTVEKFHRKRFCVLEEAPLLKNLSRLVLLTGIRYLKMSVVIKLLQYCPNLEELVTDGSMYGGYAVPRCVPSRLKSIECELLYGGGVSQRNKVEVLNYFLKNGNMLEKISIHIPSHSFAAHRDVIEKLETMMVTLNKLAKAPSRPKICEINVFFRTPEGE